MPSAASAWFSWWDETVFTVKFISMEDDLEQPFDYRSCHFLCRVRQTGPAAFQPSVLYRYGLMTLEDIALPDDTEPYASAAEALRHAQQQAVRWVHDRTGDGQGRF